MTDNGHRRRQHGGSVAPKVSHRIFLSVVAYGTAPSAPKQVRRHVRGPPANVSPIDHHNRKYSKLVHVDHHFPLHDRFPYSDRLGWGQTVGSKKIGPSDPTRALKFCQSSQLVREAVFVVSHVRSLIM